MGGEASRPQQVRMVQMPGVKVSYEDKVKRIAHVNGWKQCSTHLDSFCSFYYDPGRKYLWVVQKIGNEEVLITKPSDEYLKIVTRKHDIDVDRIEQPGVFNGF